VTKQARYLQVFNTHTQSSSSYSDPYILLESLKCRHRHIAEFSGFIQEKLSQVPASEQDSHLALICGDFNVNVLPESEDVKRMILKGNPGNQPFIEEAAKEYEYLVKTLERGEPGTIVDVMLKEYG
jgi:hypothetical protein